MLTSTEATLPDKDTCLALYRQMLVIRRCRAQYVGSAYRNSRSPGSRDDISACPKGT